MGGAEEMQCGRGGEGGEAIGVFWGGGGYARPPIRLPKVVTEKNWI